LDGVLLNGVSKRFYNSVVSGGRLCCRLWARAVILCFVWKVDRAKFELGST